jgi:Kdo2-lipid IVA lauroyltransferase/acyltransferase
MHFGPMKRFVQNHVELEGIEHWENAHAKGKGVILLGSHMGNWEIMCGAICTLAPTKSLMVTKYLKPEWLHRSLEDSRKDCDIQLAYEPKLWSKVLNHLNANGTVGYVLDQYGGTNIGVRVPYLGVPVSTNSAVAAFVKESGCQLIPITNYRLKNGKFIVKLLPAVEWTSDSHTQRELAINTANYVNVIGETVFDRPEQWLWIHRRFKGDLSPIKDSDWTDFRKKKQDKPISSLKDNKEKSYTASL